MLLPGAVFTVVVAGIYELFLATKHISKKRTFELYTICHKTDGESIQSIKACGITFGLAAVDQNIDSKTKRENLFPLTRLTKGIELKALNAEVCLGKIFFNDSLTGLILQATVKSDMDNILEAIGNPTELERSIHGVVAAAGLERILRTCKEEDAKSKYLEAVRDGRVQHLRIDLIGLEEEQIHLHNILDVLSAPAVSAEPLLKLQRSCTDFASIDSQSCEYLRIRTHAESMPESLCKLTALMELSLKQCIQLSSLPDMSHLTALRKLNLAGCTKLKQLAALVGLYDLTDLILMNCTSLVHLPELPNQLENLDLMGCTKLQFFPSNLHELHSLEKLHLDSCTSLTSLPDSLGRLITLKHLSMQFCSGLESLPPSLCNLSKLSSLNLKNCQRLSTLPDNLGSLENLTKLNLCNCTKLDSLPDLRNTKLRSVDTGMSRNSPGVVYVHGLCRVLVRSWKGCGFAPACDDGLGGGYGAAVCLFAWVKAERCHVCAICHLADDSGNYSSTASSPTFLASHSAVVNNVDEAAIQRRQIVPSEQL